MKVVLFCGGQGLRLRETSERVPKPMVPIGDRPILWHIMRYYAHFGYKDFMLCLGYKADVIKEYFLSYNEALSNDFVLSDGGREVELLQDGHPGLADHIRRHRPAGVRSASGSAPCATISTTRSVPRQLRGRADRRPICRRWSPTSRTATRSAGFLSVRPNYTFHVVEMDDGRSRPGDPRRDELRPLDQRRLLHPAAADLRLHAAGRGAGRGAVRSGSSRRQADGLPARGVLGARWTRSRTSRARELHEGGGPMGGLARPRRGRSRARPLAA